MLPLLIIGGWCMAKAMQQGSSANRESYEKSGGIAEEVLYQIKTVASFANFDYEVNKYNHWITQSMQAGIKSGFKAGFGIGFIIFVVYCSYSLAVGYGSYLISSQQVNTNSNQIFGSGDVITVLFAIIFGCLSLGQATPYVRAMYEAMYTASEFFTLMYRVPQIDLTESVEKPDRDKLSGHLSFKNVIFSYPTSPPGQVILDNININFLAGKKNAIVGGSGSGKSTMLYLMLRFYQPNIGGIYFDDYDLKRLDIKYWRSIIGYVPQEPVLFNTSIRNNIIFGREGITEEDILLACEKAYATDFVNEKGLDFIVGIKGSKLSGGQKQRIAIARAILTKPKLLILDEATSALDRKSEVEVQKALDIVSKDVTTVIIAHKIDTIKNSDMIVCLDNGKVVEQGKNDELLAKGSFYSTLVHSQEEKEKKDKQIKDERIREHINRLSLQGPIDANKIDLEILESIQEIAEEEGAFEEVEINDLNSNYY
jgi:ATP-binding cassette subfamily B (MDR/TAP) protein 1